MQARSEEELAEEIEKELIIYVRHSFKSHVWVAGRDNPMPVSFVFVRE
jgi:hypothetical protein